MNTKSDLVGTLAHNTSESAVAPVSEDSLALNPAPTLPAPHQVNHPAFTNNHTQNTNVHVNMTMPTINMSMQSHQTPFIARALWFVFVGWWLSAIFILLGWSFTVIGIVVWTLLPVGWWFLNRVPQAQTLRRRRYQFKTEYRDGAIYMTEEKIQQIPWYLRLLYLPVGLVVGAVWLVSAWVFGVLILTLPLSVWMIDRAPKVITLQRH